MVAELGEDAHAVGSRRAGWRVIARVEQKDARQADDAKEYIFVLESELQRICDGILTLMDENLSFSACTEEPKVFYNKTNGDYYRFLEEPVVFAETGADDSEGAEESRVSTGAAR